MSNFYNKGCYVQDNHHTDMEKKPVSIEIDKLRLLLLNWSLIARITQAIPQGA